MLNKCAAITQRHLPDVLGMWQLLVLGDRLVVPKMAFSYYKMALGDH